MPPFTKEVENKSMNNTTVTNFNYELSILVMSKKVGLSFEELNILTMNDFMDFIDIYLGETDAVVERDATQDDIDDFYSIM